MISGLAIEDNEDNMELITRFLQKVGFDKITMGAPNIPGALTFVDYLDKIYAAK